VVELEACALLFAADASIGSTRARPVAFAASTHAQESARRAITRRTPGLCARFVQRKAADQSAPSTARDAITLVKGHLMLLQGAACALRATSGTWGQISWEQIAKLVKLIPLPAMGKAGMVMVMAATMAMARS